MTITQKYPNKVFLVPNLSIFTKFCMGKFGGVDFKNDNIVFKFESKIPKSGDFGPRFEDFQF